MSERTSPLRIPVRPERFICAKSYTAAQVKPIWCIKIRIARGSNCEVTETSFLALLIERVVGGKRSAHAFVHHREALAREAGTDPGFVLSDQAEADSMCLAALPRTLVFVSSMDGTIEAAGRASDSASRSTS